MIVWLIGLLVVLYLSQMFIRKWFFERTGRIKNDGSVRSPVDGTVCYVREHSDFVSKKRWDSITLPRTAGEWFQIGVYMSGFDRHFVLSPLRDSVLLRVEKIGQEDATISMIGFWQFIFHYYFGRTPRLTDTSENAMLVYRFENEDTECIMAVISDKYVGKLDLLTPDPVEDETVCIIRRGSQTDIFLPMELYGKISVKVGDRLKIGDELCSI